MLCFNNSLDSSLAVNINQLGAEDPLSLLESAVNLGASISLRSNTESCFKKIDFYYYELAEKCQDLDEIDRLAILNEYFFDQKKFCINPTKPSCPEDLYIDQLIVTGYASSLPVGIVYTHLAARIDLPIYFVNSKNLTIVKWLHQGKSSFLDLMMGGKTLRQTELFDKNLICIDLENESLFEILPLRNVFSIYLDHFVEQLERTSHKDSLRKCLDLALVMNSRKFEFLAKRAVLHMSMGDGPNALRDLKRYFSFNDFKTAPVELQQAFHELQNFNSKLTSSPTLLH